jgi:putative ABC transport system permease protein
LAKKTLLSFLRDDISEEVQGDLEELFYSDLEKTSPSRAKLNYWYQVLNYLRPFAIRKFKSEYSIYLTMYKHNIKIGWRNLTKQKMYSAIKIGGLAMGLAACLLIALYLKEELSYDQSYPNASRIYRIVGRATENGVINKWVDFPAPMAKVMLKDFPEIELSARLMPNSLFPGAGSNEIRPSDNKENSYEEGFTYADGELLNMLQLQVIYGDKTNALGEPNTMVISRSKANKYFPGQNPVGKIMFLNNDKSKPWKISAVIENPPSTSHLQYNFYLSLSGIEWWQGEQSSWNADNYVDYILLRPGTNISLFEKKLTSDIGNNYYLPTMLKAGDKNAEKELATFSLHIQSVGDIHLKSYDIKDGLNHGDIRFVIMFAAIACFIFGIACINFINLSTAKSANRAREIGLKKVAGANRSVLVTQFLTESLLFSFFSFILGILLAWILLPYFNLVSVRSLVIPWSAWWLAPGLLVSAVIIGLAAGLYPSIYLSSFMPIQVLKGELSRGSKNSILRNGLVIFQFTASIILIISTIVIYNQMHFILNKKLGYNKEQVVLVQGANTLNKEVKNFKNELLKNPQVINVSVSDYLPVTGTKRNGNTFWEESKRNSESGVTGQFWRVDNDYIKTLGMKIIEGRDFNSAMPSDTQAVIINQTLANKLNLKDPVGKRIFNGGIYDVIGVVEDFNFESLRDNINGLCMQLGNSPSIISVKVNSADMQNTIVYITSVWKSFSPDQPIRYTFLDESYARMYSDVRRLVTIITGFAILAIIIACLGLLGLSAFIAEQRTKEIGIRKVMGAGIGTITGLMSKDFVILVGIAFVIASPIAYWAMNKWLQDFAFHINIGWWVFAFGGFGAVSIALITVSFQSVKTALMNPIKSLRKE